jgi:hypothetical protein
MKRRGDSTRGMKVRAKGGSIAPVNASVYAGHESANGGELKPAFGFPSRSSQAGQTRQVATRG